MRFVVHIISFDILLVNIIIILSYTTSKIVGQCLVRVLRSGSCNGYEGEEVEENTHGDFKRGITCLSIGEWIAYTYRGRRHTDPLKVEEVGHND